jgi:hypothetical protein
MNKQLVTDLMVAAVAETRAAPPGAAPPFCRRRLDKIRACPVFRRHANSISRFPAERKKCGPGN